MKKSICLILAFLLMLVLAACGSEADISGNVTANTEASATVPSGVVEAPTETEAVAETEPLDANLSLGRMEGGVYTNEYVGYGCKLDSNWTYLSAKELQQIPDTVSDAVSGTELGDALANVQQFTDMMVENASDMTTVNVLYQKQSLQERMAFMAMGEDFTIDITLQQSDALVEAYAQAGIMVSSMEKVKVTFLGEERAALHTSATIQGVPYYILQFFDFDLGSYTVTTTLASYEEDRTAELATLFYKLEN